MPSMSVNDALPVTHTLPKSSQGIFSPTKAITLLAEISAALRRGDRARAEELLPFANRAVADARNMLEEALSTAELACMETPPVSPAAIDDSLRMLIDAVEEGR